MAVRSRAVGLIYVGVALGQLVLLWFSPIRLTTRATISDFLFLILIAAHAVWGVSSLMPSRLVRARLVRSIRFPEALLAASLLLFLFLSYVQRFVEGGGNLRLALDTSTERLIAAGCAVWKRIAGRLK